MKIHRSLSITLILSFLFLGIGIFPSFCQDHIKDMDSLRASMADVSTKLPDMIKNTRNNDMRTLERVYEINTYALTTIEAYFKMIKVAISSDGKINRNMINTFNGWLQFITKYCRKDSDYLDEAIRETRAPEIMKVLQATKANIASLDKIASKAISENDDLLKKR
jgi:hypothetical protein